MKKIYTLLSLLLTFSATQAQWSTLGTGLNAEATALTFYNGELYAAGQFTVAGDTSASYIAKWNGSGWSPVGTGMNGPVRALAVYDNNLYAGGDFTEAGGVTARKIAKWNGAAWDSVGMGIRDSGFVAALAVYNGELYVGGSFMSAGEVTPVNNIARWNGSAWGAAGYGFSSQFFPMTIVKALVQYQGSLFAAGMFDHAETDFAIGVAEWNGSIWSDVSFGFNHEANCLATYGGFLYTGGSFSATAANNLPLSKFAQWDGTSWEQIGAGVDTTVSCMAVFKNDLYIGGYFKKANNMQARHLAVWNGGTFEGVPVGTDTVVLAMAADSNALYLSGKFTTAGGIAASHIARYTGPTSIKETKNIKVSCFPNPTSGAFSITAFPGLSDAEVLVYDVLGQPVFKSRFVGTKGTIDLTGFADGVYSIQLMTGNDVVASERLVIIK